MTVLGELIVVMGIDKDQLESGLKSAQAQMTQTGTDWKNLGSSMTQSGRALSVGITAPMMAGIAAIGYATNEAAEFDANMREVFSLMPGMTQEAMSTMTEQVKAFSTEVGISSSEVVPALYEALSAGVPAENVFDFMRVASVASIGGVTSLDTAVDGLTSVVNAYGAANISTQEAADQMFVAVKLGKTTFEELSASLYHVIPTAASLGVEFGDVSAALATMTAVGVPTKVATTQLRMMMIELSKAGGETSDMFKEVAGTSFTDFIAKGGNVQEALQLMEEHAQETGVGIADLFSSVDAGAAALSLTGQSTDMFSKSLAEMETSAGSAAAAFEIMDEGPARALERLKGELQLLVVEIGEAFLPILKDDLIPIIRDDLMPFIQDTVIPLIKQVAEWFHNLDPGMQKVILAAGGILMALGPMLMFFGQLVAIIPALSAAWTAITGLTWLQVSANLALVASALPYIIVILAIIAVLYLLWDNWDAIAGWLGDSWEGLCDFFTDLWGGLVDTATAIWEGLVEVAETVFTILVDVILFPLRVLWELFTAYWQLMFDIVDIVWNAILDLAEIVWTGICDIIVEPITGLIEFLTGIWQQFWDVLSGIWESMVDVASDVFNVLVDIILFPIRFIIDTIRGAWEELAGWLEGLWNGLVDVASSVWNTLIDIFVAPINIVIGFLNLLIDAINSISFDVPDWVPGIGGTHVGFSFDHVPYLAEGGIVTGPTLAMLGEDGREAVIPLDEAGRFQPITVIVEGAKDPEMVAEEVVRLITYKTGVRF